MQLEKKIFLKILIISTLSIFLISCKKEIYLDLRTVEPILVVAAEISQNNAAEVKLTQTKGFYQPNIFPTITDAKVILSNSSGQSEELTVVNDSIYKSKIIKGEINSTYYLSINYKNKIYTATSILYPPVKLDSVVAKIIQPKYPPYFQAYWQDPKGKEIDYYRFRVLINDSVKVKEKFMFSADIFDGEYLSMPIMIPERNQNDEPTFLPGDLIRFTMQTLDRATGEYFTFLSNQSKTNPPSNILGGALGYFSAYSVSSATAIAPEWEWKK